MSGLAAAATAGVVAACGSAGAGGTAGQGHHATGSDGAVVAARKLPGIGTVLVDRAGRTVYTPQVAHGRASCTGSCLSFWFPVTVATGAALRGSSGITGVLGTVHRSGGGQTQLTYDGKPLFTFRLDSAPGQAHGNDYTDHFGGVGFTWHAVLATGGLARAGAPGSSGGYSNQGGSGGY
jgi:predicted lipoprotein with Yx(FWY)xxD motif